MKGFLTTAILVLIVYFSKCADSNDVIKDQLNVNLRCNFYFEKKFSVGEIFKLFCECIGRSDRAMEILHLLGKKYGCDQNNSCECILACVIVKIQNTMFEEDLNEFTELLHIIIDCLKEHGVVINPSGIGGTDLAAAVLDCLVSLLESCRTKFDPKLSPVEILRLICRCIEENEIAQSILNDLGNIYGCSQEGSCENILTCLCKMQYKMHQEHLDQFRKLWDLTWDCLVKYGYIIDPSGENCIDLLVCLPCLLNPAPACQNVFNPNLSSDEILKFICECIINNEEANAILHDLAKKWDCSGASCEEILQCLAKLLDQLSYDDLVQFGYLLDVIMDCLIANGVISDTSGSGVDLARSFFCYLNL